MCKVTRVVQAYSLKQSYQMIRVPAVFSTSGFVAWNIEANNVDRMLAKSWFNQN